jgi:CBS domain-containing protein
MNDSVARAQELMTDFHVSHLPVVADESKLLGLINEDSLLNAPDDNTPVSRLQHESTRLTKMVADELAEFGQVTDAVDAVAKVREIRRKFGEVTTRACQASQRGRRAVNAKFFFDQIQQDAAALPKRWRRDLAPALDERPRVPENPRVAETSPADRHGIGPGFRQKPHGILSRANPAASHDRNLHRLLDAGDDRPVGPADVRLFHTAGMHIDGGRPGLLGPPPFGYIANNCQDLSLVTSRESRFEMTFDSV